MVGGQVIAVGTISSDSEITAADNIKSVTEKPDYILENNRFNQ